MAPGRDSVKSFGHERLNGTSLGQSREQAYSGSLRECEHLVIGRDSREVR